MLTLLHPAAGQVRVKGVRNSTNTALHAWLKQELAAITSALPTGPVQAKVDRAQWQRWREGLPPLRILLILDNLAGHKTPDFVYWLMDQGIMPLYTPLGGSWLNMAESAQRILVSRALSGQHPSGPEQIMEWLEATARAWSREPTLFVWGGARHLRRERARQRRHALGGSGASTLSPVAHPRRKGYAHAK